MARVTKSRKAAVEDLENRTLFEGFQYVPERVLEARGLESKGVRYNAGEPSGKNWQDDDELAQRFPRLARRFGA